MYQQRMQQRVSTVIYLKLYAFHDKVKLLDCLFEEPVVPYHWTPYIKSLFKQLIDYVSLNVDISDCNSFCNVYHQNYLEVKFKFKKLLTVNDFCNIS